MTHIRMICLAFWFLSFEACSVTEQTPAEVGQKFEEGIKGNGKIVPNDKDRSQAAPSSNPPVTEPSDSSPPIGPSTQRTVPIFNV
jgi:hypothetical protein